MNELRNETTATLTDGSTKTWRIDEATLTNGNSTFDIFENFNVVDDEFIFGGTTENGNLEWRKGFDIRTDATNAQETLIDNYVSSIVTAFSYQDKSSTIVEADFGSCTFIINPDKTISATITNENGTIFNFTLVEKTQSDYATPPTSGLDFTTAFTFEANAISCCAPDMIGSYSDNSLFLVSREVDPNVESIIPERVLKFNIDNNIFTYSHSYQPDFTSKQLHIIADRLIVVGGEYVTEYPLDFSSDPIATNHGKMLSRHGMSVLDNDAYIIGGDLDDIEGAEIFKWNIDSRTLSQFATLPEPKSGARGTIVNDHLYVFGGSETFYGETPAKTIYKLNMANPTNIETFQMNKNIDFTFVQKHQNLIYVAGRIEIRDAGVGIGREFTIGVFNTLDNSYQELTTNLTNESGWDTIHQMCIFNGKMYIIFGDNGVEPGDGGLYRIWDVLVSDLN